MKFNPGIKKLIRFFKHYEGMDIPKNAIFNIGFHQDRIDEKCKYRWTGIFCYFNSPFTSEREYVSHEDFKTYTGLCYKIRCFYYRRALNGYNRFFKDSLWCPVGK